MANDDMFSQNYQSDQARIRQLEARLAAAEAVIVAARAVADEATRCIGESIFMSHCQDVPNECIGALNTALRGLDRIDSHAASHYT